MKQLKHSEHKSSRPRVADVKIKTFIFISRDSSICVVAAAAEAPAMTNRFSSPNFNFQHWAHCSTLRPTDRLNASEPKRIQHNKSHTQNSNFTISFRFGFNFFDGITSSATLPFVYCAIIEFNVVLLLLPETERSMLRIQEVGKKTQKMTSKNTCRTDRDTRTAKHLLLRCSYSQTATIHSMHTEESNVVCLSVWVDFVEWSESIGTSG